MWSAVSGCDKIKEEYMECLCPFSWNVCGENRYGHKYAIGLTFIAKQMTLKEKIEARYKDEV